MKKTVIEQPTLCYRDEAFENLTRQNLETARQSLQKVLDKWLSLGLGSCSNISDLMFRPKNLYDQAVSNLIKFPESSGPFKLDKGKYQDQFILPDPVEMLNARNIALQQSYCAIPELWIVEGNTVVLNENVANSYINSQSIYATESKQIEFANKLNQFVNLFNELNYSLKGELLQPVSVAHALFNGKFEIREKGNNFYEILIVPEILNKWILQR